MSFDKCPTCGDMVASVRRHFCTGEATSSGPSASQDASFRRRPLVEELEIPGGKSRISDGPEANSAEKPQSSDASPQGIQLAGAGPAANPVASEAIKLGRPRITDPSKMSRSTRYRRKAEDKAK